MSTTTTTTSADFLRGAVFPNETGKETKTRNLLSENLHNTPSSVAASDVEGISQRRDARKSQQLEHERYGDGGSRGTWLKLPSARFGLRASGMPGQAPDAASFLNLNG